MNWLSTEEIKRRAKKSPEEALNVSIQEWEDKCETIRTGGEVRVGGYYCGLCARTDYFDKDCSSCCLDDGEGIGDCCQEYQDFFDDKSLPNAEAMLNRLYCERGKMYGKATKKEPKKEKVKLRHGDYGYEGGLSRILLEAMSGSKFSAGIGCCMPQEGSAIGNPTIILGNIFDDLKRNSEDLREFKMRTYHGGTLVAEIDGGNDIAFTLPITSQASANIKEATEYHQKLGQLIATAKRQETEKDSSCKK